MEKQAPLQAVQGGCGGGIGDREFPKSGRGVGLPGALLAGVGIGHDG